MRFTTLLIAGGLAALTGPALAQAGGAAATPAPVTAEEAAQLRSAANRGQQLFEIDRAARLTTRDLLARVADPESTGIDGWIAEREGNGITVTYYADTEAGPVAVYRGQVIDNRVAARDLFTGTDRPALTPAQQRLVRARAAATALDNQSCGDAPFNVLVVPPASADGPIDVYELTAQTAPRRVPLGGHYRTTVSADGSVAARHAFATRCELLEVPEAAQGAERRPLGVTNVADPLPTELHVLLSYWAGSPLLVAAGDPPRLWGVGGSEIELVARQQNVPPPGEGR